MNLRGWGLSRAVLALSHTLVEHLLYRVMTADAAAQTRVGTFGVRCLTRLNGLRSYSPIQRGRVALLKELTVEYVSVGSRRRSAWRFRPA